MVLTSSGGCANPFSRPPAFVVTAGALPDGLAVKQISDRTYGIGGTPTKAGAFTFTLTVTDPCGSAASGIFGIAVGTAITPPAPMLANPAGLLFTVKAGDPKPADQQISLTAVREQLAYSAAAQTDGGVNWLSLGNASGITPGTLIVGLASSYTLLAPGVYNGTVLIVSQATNSPVSVTVQLTVQPATPTLQVSPAALTFIYDYGRSLTPQSIVVASSSVQVKYQVTTSTASGGPWLNAVATGSDTPGSVQVSVNPAGLTAGRYQGTVMISSSAGTIAVTVTLLVSPPPSLQVNQASVAFSFRAGDAPAATQTIAVTSSTGAAVSFTAAASSPANWLFAQVTGGTTPGSIMLTANPAGLDFGSYGGTVRVQSGDPAIAPLVFNVTLTIGRPIGPS